MPGEGIPPELAEIGHSKVALLTTEAKALQSIRQGRMTPSRSSQKAVGLRAKQFCFLPPPPGGRLLNFQKVGLRECFVYRVFPCWLQGNLSLLDICCCFFLHAVDSSNWRRPKNVGLSIWEAKSSGQMLRPFDLDHRR